MHSLDVHGKRIDVHIAGYNALTTRMTYWITLQYATYAIAAASLGFMVQAGKSVDALTLSWAGLSILQLLGWAVLITIYELFTYVVYIQDVLKPQLTALLKDESEQADYQFWQFESFLNGLRRQGFIRFEQQFSLSVIYLFLAITLIVVIVRSGPPCTLSTFAWLAFNAYLAAMTALKFRHIVRLEKKVKE